MSLVFTVRVSAGDRLPSFLSIVAPPAPGSAPVSASASGAEPVQVIGAGFTGDEWPKGLYAKVSDVASAPSTIELTPDLEATFLRAGFVGSFIAFTRTSSRGVLVTKTSDSVAYRVLALASPADYALATRLAAQTARLAKTTVAVDDPSAPIAEPVSAEDLATRYDAKRANAHAREVGTWLVDDMAKERTYWFQGPRGWVELGPDQLGSVEEKARFDRALYLLVGGAYADETAVCPDERRRAILLTAAMAYAAGADGKLEKAESRQLEAHFATVRDFAGFAPRELLDVVRSEVGGLSALGELGSSRLRKKAFVLAGEVIASAQDGKLTGEATDPNVLAVTELAKALGLDDEQVFVAEVVQAASAKYTNLEVDDATAEKLVVAMLLAAAADGRIDEAESAVLSALARTVPELAKRDVTTVFDRAKKRLASDVEGSLGTLSDLGDAKHKCFALAAEVALVAGRGPEGTLLPRLRTAIAPDAAVADSVVTTFATKYA